MSEFKKLLTNAYEFDDKEDLFFRRMQSQIMLRVDAVEEKRQEKSWLQLAKVAALFVMVFMSYYLQKETRLYINSNQLVSKIDAVATEAAEQNEDITESIISYQTKEDMYLDLMNKRLAKLQDSEKERFLREIF